MFVSKNKHCELQIYSQQSIVYTPAFTFKIICKFGIPELVSMQKLRIIQLFTA